MWIIWKEELYKIASRKIVWLGVFLLLAFVSFRLFSEQNTYTTTVGGETFWGAEAIKKDQDLTKRYAGTLTLDKIRRIYEEYGFYYYDEYKKINMGNFCNRFITMEFTNYRWSDTDDPKEIRFLEGTDWENNVKPYLEQDTRFDYVYGFSDLAEIYMLTLTVLAFLLIIGLSPVFAEEYQLRTADILRTTRRGKLGGIWMKILAALFFASCLFFAVSAYLWGIYLSVYGTQGLDASAVLISFVSFYGYSPKTVAGFFVFITFLGLVSTILLTGLVAGISAMCKSPFLALILSAALYLFPVIWVKALGPMQIPGRTLTRLVNHAMASMPVYLPMSTGFSFSAKQTAWHVGIALAVGIGGMFLGYHSYRNSQ